MHGPVPMKSDDEEKTETQGTVRRMAGKKLLAFLGKPGASDAEVEKFADAMEEWDQACRFYRYGG